MTNSSMNGGLLGLVVLIALCELLVILLLFGVIEC